MTPVSEDEAAAKLAHLETLFADAFGYGPARAAVSLDADGPVAARRCGVSGEPARFVLASAPGRLEVAGNHVDHQGGRVISAAIGERTWGLAAPNGLGCIRVVMEGFGSDEIDLGDADWAAPHKVEMLTSGALVRGMAAMFARDGGALAGFDVATCSDVLPGCGLSSSAAFEVMIGACLEALFGDGSGQGEGADVVPLDPVALALAAVGTEQRYFGKPCGAQDQLASACGGVVTIDFAPDEPVVESVALDVEAAGYALVLVDSRQDHSLHNDEFAAIPADMRMVANLLGVSRLGEVSVQMLLDSLAEVRATLGDRRAMRALHYYDEVERVQAQRTALDDGDFAAFLKLVRLSGASSAQFLQNVSLREPGSDEQQPAMLIQSLCAHLLGEAGAWRIHGGGFGGAVLAFVPRERADEFVAAMDGFLGYEACRRVTVGGPGVRARRLS